MVEDLRNEFSEWYFGVKETNGDRPPLAMQIFYWFENRLDLPHLIGTKEYGGENLKTEIVKLNKIIETKEAERSEWANMCIKKQEKIEGLGKLLKMCDCPQAAIDNPDLILKMKITPRSEWTGEMKEWGERSIAEYEKSLEPTDKQIERMNEQ